MNYSTHVLKCKVFGEKFDFFLINLNQCMWVWDSFKLRYA